MSRRTQFLVFLGAATLNGCASLQSLPLVKELTTERQSYVEREPTYEEQALNRVVYTPLAKSRTPTAADDIEILLRAPKAEYKELGFISMYRENRDETAASLLKFVRQRAAQEGANAVLLTEVEDKAVGTRTTAAASTWGGDTFASAKSTFIREGTIRGVAIAYEASPASASSGTSVNPSVVER